MTAVWGFIAQCEICPQKAILGEQPAEPWICPRCAEVTDPSPSVAAVTLPADDPLAQAIKAQSIKAAGPPRVTADVAGNLFVLDSYSEERQVCVCGKPHGPAVVTTRWSRAVIPMLTGFVNFHTGEEYGVDDDGYPIGKVQG